MCYTADIDTTQSTGYDNPRRTRDPEATLVAAVSAKVEEGNLKAAVRLLCSDETVAQVCEETAAQLQEKHPPPPLLRLTLSPQITILI